MRIEAKKRILRQIFVILPILAAMVLFENCNGGFRVSQASKVLTDKLPTKVGCMVGSVTLAEGESRVFYSTPTATLPKTCGALAQAQTCINGNLTGPLTYMECNFTPSPTIFISTDPTTWQHVLTTNTIQGVRPIWAFGGENESAHQDARPILAGNSVQRASSF